MSALKILLLIGVFVFGGAILLAWLYLSPKQSEPAQQIPLPSPPVEIKNRKPEPEKNSKPTIPAAAAADKTLQPQADALLSLFDKMPSVPVYIKDEPIIKSGAKNERSDAYTTCERGGMPIIIVKKITYQKFNQIRLTNLLKHELTHAWLCRQNLMSNGHGKLFQQKFKQVGGFGN